MKRRVKVAVILCVMACVGMLAGRPSLLAGAQTRPLASLDPVGGLIQHQTAQGDPNDLAAWQTVVAPILVGEGDRIRTDNAGLAYLTFFEGIQTEIQANTLVVVSTLALPENGEVLNVSVDVLVGSTFSSIETALKPEDRFEVHTPGATAVVRGTEWWTMVEPNGDSSFAAERGEVDVIFHRLLPVVAAAPGAAAEGAGEPSADAALNATESGLAGFGNIAEAARLSEGGTIRATREGSNLGTSTTYLLPTRRETTIRPLVLATCGDGVCGPRESHACPVDCLDRATLPACGDGTCDPAAGEGLLVCGADCGPFAGEQCGNGVCDRDESGLTCAADCAANAYFSPVDKSLCGNETCDPTESALNCPADCGTAETK